MADAAGTVFNTPELLEAILLEMPLQKVLLAQRVNSFWQNTIKISPKLQQKLFFKASNSATNDSTKMPMVNPMLSQIFEGHFNVYYERGVCTCHGEQKYVLGPGKPDHMTIYQQPWKLRFLPPAKMYELASWRSMLVTDPMCPIHFHGLGETAEGNARWTVHPIKPTNLGETIEKLKVLEVE